MIRDLTKQLEAERSERRSLQSRSQAALSEAEARQKAVEQEYRYEQREREALIGALGATLTHEAGGRSRTSR